MRAIFKDTVNLYTGPGTTSPYTKYITAAPCRLVPNPLFRTLEPPQNGGVDYFTIELTQPAGPTVTDLGSDSWRYEYAKADRAEFASDPGVLWKVLSVVACTGPDQATYWRCQVAPTSETPLTPCQRIYRNRYQLVFYDGRPTIIVTRFNATLWINGGTLLQAEVTGPPGLGCSSTWAVLGGGFFSGPYFGSTSVRLYQGGDLTKWVQVSDIP